MKYEGSLQAAVEPQKLRREAEQEQHICSLLWLQIRAECFCFYYLSKGSKRGVNLLRDDGRRAASVGITILAWQRERKK